MHGKEKLENQKVVGQTSGHGSVRKAGGFTWTRRRGGRRPAARSGSSCRREEGA